MNGQNPKSCTAFKSDQRVASGNLLKVAGKVKEIIDQDEQAAILIFDDETSELVEVDFRGSVEDVLKRMAASTTSRETDDNSSDKGQRSRPGPGRPKLGVVSREVTLLPRHWEWLGSQPGGASVALRKLVDEARKVNSSKDKVRRAQEATYRFMSAMAGNFPGFEEASRALFAGDANRFNNLIDSWPIDIRNHTQKLSEPAFQNL
jgi:uncharacterized protein